MKIAILGGTGPEGAGLALRWALAGHEVIIGSRQAERAKAKAAELSERAKGATIVGMANREAAAAGAGGVVALPAAGLAATLPDVKDACRGKTVVCTVVPLTFGGPRLHTPPSAGSAAEGAPAHLGPEAHLVAGLHHLPP